MTTESNETETETSESETETVDVEALQKQLAEVTAERDKFKHFSRKNEDELKKVLAETDTNKSDAERLQDQLNKLQSELETERAERLRYSIAAEQNIPKDKADRWLTAADEDGLRDQARELADMLAQHDKAASGPRSPSEGTTENPPALNSDRLTNALAKAVGATT